MKTGKDFAIIGGGMLGLTLALRLASKGKKVTVFESAPNAGGLAGSWEMNGIVWDKFYHVILMSDNYTRRVLQEIGLEGEITWVETKTGFHSGGRLHSMSNVWEFLRFPPVNLVDKFRLGLTILIASRIKNWRKLEQIPVDVWLRHWSGNRVFEKIWLPLLRAKLGDNYKQTSAAFIWATIQRMYAARRTGLKKEMFGYVPGGYERIINEFTRQITRLGVKIRYNSPVTTVEMSKAGRMSLKVEGNERSENFDIIISTLASPHSARIAAGMDENEREAHFSISYLGVICPTLLLKKAVSPYYVTNITDGSPPFTGIIEMTALIGHNELKGKHLVYLPKYLHPEDTLFRKSDKVLCQSFQAAFLKMYPTIRKEDICFRGVSRAKYVFTLPSINYSLKLPGIKTSLGNYYIINSAQIINGTLNVNETIKVAETKLEELLNEKEK